MRRLLLLVLVSTASTWTVKAQTLPPGPPAVDVPVSADGGAQAAKTDAKKPRRALLLSGLGSAAILVPLVNLAAIPAGPALGHFYAGNERQAWTGIAIRGTAMGVAVAALLGDALGGYDGGRDRGGSGDSVALGCVIVILGSAAYDVATAGASARAYNRRHGLRTAALPVVGPKGQVGMLVAVRL